jgi:hypothetical protein
MTTTITFYITVANDKITLTNNIITQEINGEDTDLQSVTDFFSSLLNDDVRNKYSELHTKKIL